MNGITHFPSPRQRECLRQIAALAAEFHLSAMQTQAVKRKALREMAEGRSNAVAVMHARRALHAGPFSA